jgi:ribonuclease PH
MTESGKFVEIQGTGEETSFTKEQLNQMIEVGERAITNLIAYQKSVIMNSFL